MLHTKIDISNVPLAIKDFEWTKLLHFRKRLRFLKYNNFVQNGRWDLSKSHCTWGIKLNVSTSATCSNIICNKDSTTVSGCGSGDSITYTGTTEVVVHIGYQYNNPLISPRKERHLTVFCFKVIIFERQIFHHIKLGSGFEYTEQLDVYFPKMDNKTIMAQHKIVNILRPRQNGCPFPDDIF